MIIKSAPTKQTAVLSHDVVTQFDFLCTHPLEVSLNLTSFRLKQTPFNAYYLLSIHSSLFCVVSALWNY